ncbi:hypothetical protein MKQ68_15330 [Chitinophaga horti]|uniref:DUF3303 domain-containing protein n=1 Tax=Chitinophaga horti TaxID=2920382 RepID=A0ABY6IZP3_9BACT|nr:hypothetical protein [Chitinophaga horti]UYQ91464.1 hypothetical protein MKQ68_15330 [Chitinophaga horti]
MKPMTEERIELITVFKKDIGQPDAEKLLAAHQLTYRKGMDSSRGKLYFQRTGPKFILTFDSDAAREAMITLLEQQENIHEVYIPDWTKCKD